MRESDRKEVISTVEGLRVLGLLDCGLFHTFDDDERRDYVVSPASVTGRGGHM